MPVGCGFTIDPPNLFSHREVCEHKHSERCAYLDGEKATSWSLKSMQGKSTMTSMYSQYNHSIG